MRRKAKSQDPAIVDLREALYLESRRTQDAVRASRAAVREYVRMRDDIALLERKIDALVERVRQPLLPLPPPGSRIS